MNFTNRDNGRQQSQPIHANLSGGATPVNVATTPNTTLKTNSNGSKRKPDWLRGTWVVMLFSVSVILLSLVYLLHIGNPNTGKYVDDKRLQAVFLANGQVYFGKIKSISSKYIDLRSIFYLNNPASTTQANTSATTPTSLSLVKLGCELHGPYDSMIINQEQVTFWENLRDDGQVAKAIAQYQKDNKNGISCNDSAPGSTSQGATNPQGTTTEKKQ